MRSLPTIDQGTYEFERINNDEKASNLFGQLFPNFLVPYPYIFEIIDFLQETQVNAQVIPQVIRGIHNLVIGSGKGQVIVHVNNDLMNVQVREQSDEIVTKL